MMLGAPTKKQPPNKSYPLVIQHSSGQLGPFGSFSSMIYPWKNSYCPQRQTNRRYIPTPSSSQPTNSPLPRPFLRNSHENNATRTILEEVDWMRFLSCRQWNIRRYGGILSHGGSPNHHGCFNTKSGSWMIFFWGYPVLGHLHMIFTDDDLSWMSIPGIVMNSRDKNSGDVAAPRILLLSNGRAKHGYDNQLLGGTNLKVWP